MKIAKCALLFAGALCLFSSVSLSQAIKVKLHISYPSISFADSISLYFGFDLNATDCIALSGGEFGEYEIPQVPYPGFLAAFRNPNPPFGDDTCYGQGSFSDFRKWGDGVDTFLIKLQPYGPDTTFLWTWRAGLEKNFQYLTLKDAIFGSFSFNMLEETSASTSPLITQWYIIALMQPPPSVRSDNTMPDAFALHQNYPNPFNPSTSIQYTLPSQSNVTLEVFNTLGQRVARIIDAQQQAGSYEQSWNAGSAASGLYYYRLTVVNAGNLEQNFTQVKKMLLLR